MHLIVWESVCQGVFACDLSVLSGILSRQLLFCFGKSVKKGFLTPQMDIDLNPHVIRMLVWATEAGKKEIEDGFLPAQE